MVVSRRKIVNRPGQPRGPATSNQTLVMGPKCNLDNPEVGTSEGVKYNLHRSNPKDMEIHSNRDTCEEAA